MEILSKDGKKVLSREEFNKFLSNPDTPIYSATNNKIFSAGYFGVGEGWNLLLYTLLNKLLSLGWDGKIIQCKEKFGSLRFSVSVNDRQIKHYIQEFERESMNICSVCGESGAFQKMVNNYVHTKCESCFSKN